MKRLFFGLASTDASRQLCTSLLQAITDNGNQPVPLANLHVTLVFLGLLNTEVENALLGEASTVVCKKFAINFDQLSYWQKPGILCLTSRENISELFSIVRQLTALAKKWEITLDGRAYQAHVTLARKAKQAIDLAFEPIVWQADAFCLFESCPTENGVEYRVLKRWALVD